jgi:hypothetical protein
MFFEISFGRNAGMRRPQRMPDAEALDRIPPANVDYAHHVLSRCLHQAAARFSGVSTPLASARIIHVKPHQPATQPPWTWFLRSQLCFAAKSNRGHVRMPVWATLGRS